MQVKFHNVMDLLIWKVHNDNNNNNNNNNKGLTAPKVNYTSAIGWQMAARDVISITLRQV